MDVIFKGWVPTVLGNLSFRLVGHSGYPYPFYTFINENQKSGTLKILCLQKRIPPDYQIPLPFPLPNTWYLWLCCWVAKNIFSENIESIYILSCSGKVDGPARSIQIIHGTIYRFIETNSQKQRNLFNQLKQDLSLGHFSEYDDFFFCCDFELNRQGICTLKNPCVKNEEALSRDPGDDIKRLINQCFFFVKDSFHSHKHHSKEEDTLVSAHPEKDEHGFTWSEQIIKDIYRYLIRQRPAVEKKTLGIFTYLRTFNKIQKHNGNQLDQQSQNGTTLFDRTIALDELEKSISIDLDEKADKITFKRWFAGISMAVTQLILFYYFSAYNTEAKQIIQTYPFLILAVALAAFFVILISTENLIPRYWKNSLRFTNLCISYFENKRASTTFLFVLSIVFFILGFWLLLSFK